MDSCKICGGSCRNIEGSPGFSICDGCRTIWRDDLLSREQESSRYLLHENSAGNRGYVEYLQKFLDQCVLPYVPSGAAVLDFGSGPEPVLSRMLSEHGFPVSSYDPFFLPDTSYRSRSYDAVILLEVAEHLHDPLSELRALKDLLNDHALIIIRTQTTDHLSEEGFSRWWYKEDPTHVVFYSAESAKALADALGMDLLIPGKNLFLLFRKG